MFINQGDGRMKTLTKEDKTKVVKLQKIVGILCLLGAIVNYVYGQISEALLLIMAGALIIVLIHVSKKILDKKKLDKKK
jgi:hypothetical protein